MEIEEAVSGLRRAGGVEFLVRGLLTRAWQRSLTGRRSGPESAQSDLDEAWEIAARGPMPLFMAEIRLHRARLFGRPAVGESGSVGRPATAGGQRKATAGGQRKATAGSTPHPTSSQRGAEQVNYPWESPEHDLREARRLIKKHGYGRRLEELADAEAALNPRFQAPPPKAEK